MSKSMPCSSLCPCPCPFPCPCPCTRPCPCLCSRPPLCQLHKSVIHFGLFRTADLCFGSFRNGFETPKQTEKIVSEFREKDRNKTETDRVSVCFSSNWNKKLFVSRTPRLYAVLHVYFAPRSRQGFPSWLVMWIVFLSNVGISKCYFSGTGEGEGGEKGKKGETQAAALGWCLLT